ncbi:hypothetical protein ACGFY6_27935 [Streptomyces sp. NPDC048387]|uniref:hypothetical protein n=1 Tax=unclassified Streptomyces TaxID=2593676 RepID=UPI0036AD678D
MSSRPVRRSRPAAVLALATALLAVVVALAGPVRGVADTPVAPAGAGQTGVAAPTGAGEGAALDGPPSRGSFAAAASPQGGDAVARAASAGSEPGPACGPGSGRDGVVPVVPSRGGHEHVSVLAARPAPEGVRPYRADCVRVPVRGPGQRAPGPVELSVMRV